MSIESLRAQADAKREELTNLFHFINKLPIIKREAYQDQFNLVHEEYRKAEHAYNQQLSENERVAVEQWAEYWTNKFKE